MKRRLTICAILGLASASLLAQEEVNPVEAKLRESLRATMLQQRNTEAERARLDAELAALKVQSEAQIKELNAKLKTAIQRGDDEKAAADKVIAAQKKQVAELEAREKALRENLDQWRTAHSEVSDIARRKEEERAALKAETIALKRLVETRERQNLELYDTGKEVLKRYEDFGLGRALIAREPFTGLSRVKIEEQVQDYRDKLTDGLVKTDGTDNKPPPPAATTPTPSELPPEP